jgi:hypothetical protein
MTGIGLGNFTNLNKNVKQTIEFRQPPGVIDKQNYVKWVEFTLRFCRAAGKFATSYSKLRQFLATNDGLEEFLSASFRNRGAIIPSLSINSRAAILNQEDMEDFEVVELDEDWLDGLGELNEDAVGLAQRLGELDLLGDGFQRVSRDEARGIVVEEPMSGFGVIEDRARFQARVAEEDMDDMFARRFEMVDV